MPDYLSMSARRPETRILAAISGLWMSRLVGFAAKAGLFEAIDSGLGRVAEIAKEKDLAEDPLARALEGLVHLGFLERNDDRYVLTDDGRLMLPGATGGFKDMAALWNELFDGAWAELETTIRTGQPGFTVRHGETLFARIGHDGAAAKHFVGAMRGLSQLIAREASILIATRLRASGCTSICDVGGGDGFLIAEIARICPNVECVLFDVPQVIELSSAHLSDYGVVGVSGSFFTSVPRADAHILSNVIHDWSDEEALRILKNVRRAQGQGSTLFILEMMLGGDTEPLLARSTDLNMLVLTGGRERTRDDFDSLLSEAGYRIASVQSIVDLTCLLEAVPV